MNKIAATDLIYRLVVRLASFLAFIAILTTTIVLTTLAPGTAVGVVVVELWGKMVCPVRVLMRLILGTLPIARTLARIPMRPYRSQCISRG